MILFNLIGRTQRLKLLLSLWQNNIFPLQRPQRQSHRMNQKIIDHLQSYIPTSPMWGRCMKTIDGPSTLSVSSQRTLRILHWIPSQSFSLCLPNNWYNPTATAASLCPFTWTHHSDLSLCHHKSHITPQLCATNTNPLPRLAITTQKGNKEESVPRSRYQMGRMNLKTTTTPPSGKTLTTRRKSACTSSSWTC